MVVPIRRRDTQTRQGKVYKSMPFQEVVQNIPWNQYNITTWITLAGVKIKYYICKIHRDIQQICRGEVSRLLYTHYITATVHFIIKKTNTTLEEKTGVVARLLCFVPLRIVLAPTEGAIGITDTPLLCSKTGAFFYSGDFNS